MQRARRGWRSGGARLRSGRAGGRGPSSRSVSRLREGVVVVVWVLLVGVGWVWSCLVWVVLKGGMEYGWASWSQAGVPLAGISVCFLTYPSCIEWHFLASNYAQLLCGYPCCFRIPHPLSLPSAPPHEPLNSNLTLSSTSPLRHDSGLVTLTQLLDHSPGLASATSSSSASIQHQPQG